MINVSNICVQFGGIDLFKEVTFLINPKDRIGLVGKNGVGKSTLLNIIAGKMDPESGSVIIAEGETVGYLPQEISVNSHKSIYEETLSVFEEAIRIEQEIEQINKQLEERTDYESESYIDLITSLTEKHERFNLIGGNQKEEGIGKMLKGLGFSESDFERPISEFSGGWQMRVELAKLLLMRPSLLLLDEPTNHLDIESILWLENFLINYPGAVMMVSHDRMFLDNITNRTVEIAFAKIHDYKASYSKYFELREERLATQHAAFKNQQKYIAQQERFIERFKAKNTKAKQAQSKMKQLEKIERVGFDEMDNQSIKFRFSPAPRSGDISLKVEHVNKNYGELKVLQDVNFELERGDRVAFVGKNGQGKSTLVKLINQEEEYNGAIKPGHNVELGYYAQIQEKTLDEGITVLQTIEREATGEMAKIHKVRSLLGAFLFGNDDVDKKVKVLSGGEKSRLALARLLLKPCNLLILDEPTNHLDISAKEVLKEALLNYNGTLIVVSHDRDFLQGLTNRTFEFKEGAVKEHMGTVDDFLEGYKLENFRDFEFGGKQKEVVQQKKASSNKQEFTKKKANEKRIRKLKSTIQRYERKINEFEQEKAQLEVELGQIDYTSKTEANGDLFYKHSELQRQIDAAMQQWEQCQEELEQAEK